MFESLGNIGDFVGGIGVIVTLAYLAVQIRRNTRALRSNTHQAMMDSGHGINTTLTEHPELARLLIKANSDLSTLSPEEEVQFRAFASRYFGVFENAFYQRSQGLVDDAMWEAWSKSFQADLSPAMRSVWAGQRDRYLSAYREYVDDLG